MSVTMAQLKLQPHTTLYKNIFLLRVPVTINGQPVEIGCDEKGWLTLNCRYPEAKVTFDSLITDVNEVLQSRGMECISNYWCEEVPLFELKIYSQSELNKLLNLEEEIQEELASKIAKRIAAQLMSTPASVTTAKYEVNVVVQPHVYLLIPDYTSMDGKAIQINKSNITMCMSLFAESGIFDFGAFFRALRVNPTQDDKGPEDLRQLVYELNEVVDWYHLGLHLEIPDVELQIIAKDHPQDTKMCRTKMLSWWMNNVEERKWATIVHALVRTGSRFLASKIALKYGVPVPNSSSQITMAKVTQEPPQEEVKQMKSAIECKDQELAQQHHALKQARKEKKQYEQKLKDMSQMIQHAESKITQLENEKSKLENKLELQEFELKLICLCATTEIKKQQQIITFKEQEMNDHKAQLQIVSEQLTALQEQHSSLQKQLLDVQAELEKKSRVVKNQEEAEEKKKCELEAMRVNINDYLLQQATASSHDASYELKLQQQDKKVAPEEMKRGAAVNHNDKTYIIKRDSSTIYSYELGRDKWKKHCTCRYVNTRLVIISSLLTAVGGEMERSGRSNELLSWKGNKWVNEFPPMQKARSDHAVVSNDAYVIALGGDGDDTGVEVFSISSSMWSTVTSLPKRLPYITATLCKHDIIAMDRDGHTYTASIQSLLSSVKSASNYIHWKQICNPPLGEGECGPTLTTFHGYAVAVHNGIYQLVGGKWVKIGDMHHPRWDCIVCVVQDQIVIVGGGYGYTHPITKTIEVFRQPNP